MAESETRTIEQDEEEHRTGPPRWLRPLRDWVLRFPAGELIWKIIVGFVGAAILVAGLLLIPLPGPGWAIVFLGLAVWATEFYWAHRLLRRARQILRRWTDWARRQPILVRLVIGVVGLAVLAGVVYLAWTLLL